MSIACCSKASDRRRDQGRAGFQDHLIPDSEAPSAPVTPRQKPSSPAENLYRGIANIRGPDRSVDRQPFERADGRDARNGALTGRSELKTVALSQEQPEEAIVQHQELRAAGPIDAVIPFRIGDLFQRE